MAPHVPLPADLPRREPSRRLRRFALTVALTLAACAVTAIAVRLPMDQARHEARAHYPSTRYIDVPRGHSGVFHQVRWTLRSIKQVPVRHDGITSPPPGDFVRVSAWLHARLLGDRARLPPSDAGSYLSGYLGTDGDGFRFQMRDHHERAWDPILNAAKTEDWCCGHYTPARGMRFEVRADVPARLADEVMPTLTWHPKTSVTSTPPPRETAFRLLR